ncbi:MAG: bifunctional DNA-formamidopyrimidine glycosylase/DNA-(apurinic or apyrimidinic site) lyase [Patescibacteria group bacterium]
MPELPEVETIVGDLNKNILNRKIQDVWSNTAKFKVESLKLKVVGSKIKKVGRVGKNILLYLTRGKILLIHQKMTGHLMYGKWKKEKAPDGKEKVSSLLKGPFQENVNNYIHLIIYLDNGWQVALSDLRKFAKVEVFNARNAGEIKELKNLGPDALKVKFVDFKKNIAVKKGPIKQVLMNQEFIAGIGNIYGDEILWKAGVHPERKANSLSAVALKKIFKAMKFILKKAVKKRGTSISDFRDAYGEKGKYGDERLAYRREGKPCFRCKNKIARIKINGRSSCFCPVCQK